MQETSNSRPYVCELLNSGHKDLIHDVSFDFYGKRMATCSSDQTVKVWELKENGKWECSSSWKTHNGSVGKITWANPEFGQVLATCSFDRTAAIWEEVETSNRKMSWIRKANLVDSRAAVTDVKFSPKHLGFQLATCSADGYVRIYEAPDILNCSTWSVQHQIKCKIRCSCISWNPSCYRGFQPLLAVGSDDNNSAAGGKVLIYEYNDISRSWVKVHVISSITEPVHDLSFAPHFGIKRHILAVASDNLHVFNLRPISDLNIGEHREPTKFAHQETAKFNDHESNVWRVAWNVIGTVLASSGNDGRVILWKANYLDNWRKITTFDSDIDVTADSSEMAASPPNIAMEVAPSLFSSPLNNRYY